MCVCVCVCVCVGRETEWEKETEGNRAINCQEYSDGASSHYTFHRCPENRRVKPRQQESRPTCKGQPSFPDRLCHQTQGQPSFPDSSAIKHKVRRSEPPSHYDIRQVWGPLRMTCAVSHLPWALCLLTVWLTLWAACRRRAPHIPQLVQEAACATVS